MDSNTLSPGGQNDQTSGKPRTRQRAYKAPPTLDVPDIDEDANERKRVLNVLAQRRYREKKRAARKRAGAKDKAVDSPDTTLNENSPPLDDTIEEVICSTQADAIPSVQTTLSMGMLDFEFALGSWDGIDTMGMPNLLSGSGFSPANDSSDSSLSPEVFTAPGSTSPDMFSAIIGSPLSFGTPSASSSSSSRPQTPISMDSFVLPLNDFNLLRAFSRIAHRLGCRNEELWSLDGNSPFNQGTATPADQLPVSWRPTPLQVLVKHHPVVDFMPWPSVRERLISIFSMPEDLRPPQAVGPTALVNLAYDFEDTAEGLRIYGEDPYDPNYWEVGQVFFERWWFLFDREIIANSNKWRKLRGAPALQMKK